MVLILDSVSVDVVFTFDVLYVRGELGDAIPVTNLSWIMILGSRRAGICEGLWSVGT